MKKLILITLTILTLSSCSTEENRLGEPLPNPTCTCVKIEEYATSATNFTVWIATGNISPSDFPCSQNGYTEFLYAYTSGSGNVVKVRFRVHCE